MSQNYSERHTFVILAYGNSSHLEACIQSVLQQSCKSQVVIATSTLSSFIQQLAERYGLKVFVNERGGSIGKDWNFGFSIAQTPYVTLAHQDDVYHTDFLKECILLAEQHELEHPFIVFTTSTTERRGVVLQHDYKNILRRLLIFPFHFSRCIRSPFWKKFILLFSNSISCPGVFYVKKNLGNFRFDDAQKFVLDWDAWYRMSQLEGSFIYASKHLHLHREHEASATSNILIEELKQEELQLLSRMWNSQWIARLITGLLSITK